MKLTTVITLVFLIQVSALTKAQIRLNEKGASLQKVLEAISKQSGYDLVYSNLDFKNAKPVTISLNNVSLEKALEASFQGQPLIYEIADQTVMIRKKPEQSFFEKVIARFQAIDVRGRVVDENGQALVGASVKVKETNKSTSTNSNGEFYLQNVDDNAMIVISYIGYENNEVKAAKDLGVIKLEIVSGELEEVIINKGYYATTKATNTGSVSTVNYGDLIKSAAGDPLAALQGRIAGLYVNQSSGNAGAKVNVQLRGKNSIANGNDLLYIIDGIPFNSNTLTLGNGGGAANLLSPFAGLNAENIEKIEVLKDADATAIYGSRGANGVMLITTKKATSGKSTLNVNVYQGAGKAASKLDLMNTREYLQMRNEARQNDGITTDPTDPDLIGAYGDINKYTDWQKVFIGGTSHLTDANASISGGSETTQFLLGGGYRHETSVFPGDYFDRKASFNANINHHDGNFTTTFSINYLNDDNQSSPTDFTNKILIAPNSPDLYTPEGKLNWQNGAWENPLWITTKRTKNLTETVNSALSLSYEWIPELTTSLRTGYNLAQNHFNILDPFVDYNPDFVVTPEYRSNSYGDNKVKTWFIEPTVNFNKKIGGGKLESLIGGTFQQTDNSGLYGIAAGFSSPEMIENIFAGTYQFISGNVDTRYRYNAIYARVAYNYEEKYLLNLTGRRDASSRFGPNKKFANLGAIGAGWIFTRESGIADVLPFLSFGKIRGSYGITGNDQLTDYEYLSTYETPSSKSYQSNGGLIPKSLTNPLYGWETVKKLEGGLELSFLKDRISFNMNVYLNRTGNQLVGYALPSITGFTSIRANLPAVIQNSGVEFDFTADVFVKNFFKWAISGNLTVPKNKLVSYPNIENSSYASRYVIGQPLFIRFFYNYTGIDPEKNIYRFEDRNEDSQISGQLDRVPAFIGQRYYGGLNNSFKYKGLRLDVFFQYVKQTGYKMVTYSPGLFDNEVPNQLKDVLQEEKNGKIQQFSQLQGSEEVNAFNIFAQSNGTVVDASFIRLKNISLSWAIPTRYSQMLKIKNLSVYLRGQNLLTITNFKGFDPENSANLAGSAQLTLPPLKMVTAGLQFSL